MNIRFTLTTLACAAWAACGLESAVAQNAILVVDRDTNSMSITTDAADGAGYSMSGYSVTSALGAINPANWTQIAPANTWREAGTSSANSISELQEDGATAIAANNSAPISLGAPFDPTAAKLAAGFNVDVEDLAFTYFDPALQQSVSPAVVYTGEKIYNSLVLNIDASTGAATIENESPFDVGLTGYLIGSDAGELSTSWAGIRQTDPANWVAADGATANNVAELNQNPNSNQLVLNAGASTPLGSLYTGDGTNQDLTFEFTLQGELVPFTSVVKYSNVSSGLPGDLDGSGFVDGVDFLTFQRGFPGTYDATDLADFQANYGMSSAPGAANIGAVPEPTAALLCLIGLLGLGSVRRSKK